jgi:predicted GNAT family acetyltransferase
MLISLDAVGHAERHLQRAETVTPDWIRKKGNMERLHAAVMVAIRKSMEQLSHSDVASEDQDTDGSDNTSPSESEGDLNAEVGPDFTIDFCVMDIEEFNTIIPKLPKISDYCKIKYELVDGRIRITAVPAHIHARAVNAWVHKIESWSSNNTVDENKSGPLRNTGDACKFLVPFVAYA